MIGALTRRRRPSSHHLRLRLDYRRPHHREAITETSSTSHCQTPEEALPFNDSPTAHCTLLPSFFSH